MAKRSRTVRVPLYHASTVVFLIGWSAAEVQKKYDVDRLDGTYGGAILETSAYGVLVLWLVDASDMPSLAHEAVHAAGRILDLHGVKLDPSNDEPMAYLVSWIMAEGLKTSELQTRRSRGLSKTNTRVSV